MFDERLLGEEQGEVSCEQCAVPNQEHSNDKFSIAAVHRKLAQELVQAADKERRLAQQVEQLKRRNRQIFCPFVFM